ncbi:PAS domain-containing protein [Streptomyces sp. NPDC057539]|uniref:PAS domain-containing protein n=1 Tax=Streptomyces sp. NPDC057539 TaxID=3346159 RepID=UPI0036C640BC
MSSRPSRGAARLAAILDALPDGLVLVNANGTVVNANTIALEMFETPGTALVGRGLLDLLPEFDSRLIPGSMRRPETADARGRTKPTRMIARRTDGGEFPAEVTSASLEDGRDAYNDSHSYTGDELLMLVVRDLSGTMDTEAELARSQRQTEMILRAASEGVVGTDTEGRVVLVNPAAAQILGFRASDLGGHRLHPLILHSRADGEPFPYEDSPLADTLRSGRKHRVRGQVLWAKNGKQVPVDLTTAPVRDGDQLVGAVMTFTDRRPYDDLTKQHAAELATAEERHTAELTETTERLTTELTDTTERLRAELTETTERLRAELAEATERHAAELADRSDRYAAEIEELTERYGETSDRHSQLTAVLGESLRGPLVELRGELATLAADPAGQLWPEANQILHHLAAGYSRMTTLVDNVLGYQRLDAGTEQLIKTNTLLDGVVAAGVEGAVELIGPGRAQFAVHAPPIEAEVDPGRLATALAHLIADVAGVDSTGRARLMPGGGYVDSTIVVAAAQRSDVVRIEVRGPFAGGDPVHEPIVRGIVRAHGGVLQTHEVPGMGGSAYVLELPLGEGAGTVRPPAGVPGSAQPALPAQASGTGTGTDTGAGTGAGTSGGGGRRRARRSSTDAFLASATEDAGEPTGRRRARAAEPEAEAAPGTGAAGVGTAGSGAGTDGAGTDGSGAGSGAGAEGAGPGGPGVRQDLIPAQGTGGGSGTGRRRGRPSPADDAAAAAGAGPGVGGPGGGGPAAGGPYPGSAFALPAAPASEGSVVTAAEGAHPTGRAALGQAVPPQGVPTDAAGTGRRARHGGQGGPDGPGGQTDQGGRGGQPGRGGQAGQGRRALPALPAGPLTPAAPMAPAAPAPVSPPAPTGVATTAAPAAAASPGVPPVPAGPAPAVPRPASAPAAPAAPAPMPLRPAQPAPPAGRRARRALAPAQERHIPVPAEPEGARSPFALPPAEADRTPGPGHGPGPAAGPGHGPGASPAHSALPVPGDSLASGGSLPGRHDAVRTNPDDDHTPPQPHPLPSGRGRRGAFAETEDAPNPNVWGSPDPTPPGRFTQDHGYGHGAGPAPRTGPASDGQGMASNGQGMPTTSGFGTMAAPPGWPDDPAATNSPTNSAPGAPGNASGNATGNVSVPSAARTSPAPGEVPEDPSAQSQSQSQSQPPSAAHAVAVPNPRRGAHQPLPPAQPLPEEAPVSADSTQGRAFSVRTLGQGVPFTQQPPHQQNQPQAPGQPPNQAPGQTPGQPQSLGSGRRRKLGTPPDGTERPDPSGPGPHAGSGPGAHPAVGAGASPGGSRLPHAHPEGRSYAIGAPDEGAEGPEPLDGPGGAVEVANRPQPRPVDDELPPEPLDNPRRLLVWPAPDVSTQQALSDRGYRPVVVHSREEVDAQIAAFPAALFVDPLTGPITRTALQSLRQAAVAAEVPVLVTAGLGQATREAAYGADPAVLLKALAPRDSEQHPPRVLLIEENEEIALALTETLERRGMQVALAATDNEAVNLATQMRPNLVVMDLMQVRRRRAGIIDWLRANGQLNRTPLVIYTSAGIDRTELPRLASGETVLFLAERSTSDEVQSRIVDLLAKIGTN